MSFGGDGEFSRFLCCGTWTCLQCFSPTSDSTVSAAGCPFCSFPKSSETEVFARMKKWAKKGYAWGQYALGSAYHRGTSVKPSNSDAFRWFSKASKKNHPEAHWLLGIMFTEGHGSAADLAKAHHHLKSAMSFGVEVLGEDCRANLIDLAKRYMGVDATVAKSILDQLIDTSRGDGLSDSDALLCRGNLFIKDGDCSMASCMFRGAFLNGMKHGLDVTASAMSSSSVCAFMCACQLGFVAQAAFWMRRITISSICIDSRRESVGRLVSFRRGLREQRDICGGCGIEFEGKERKFCRGCRAYCYCSRECQKTHWNRKNDGHREDCKGLMELKQKVKEAKRMAMLGK